MRCKPRRSNGGRSARGDRTTSQPRLTRVRSLLAEATRTQILGQL
ncbi:hypothetical protein [Moorena sp. SIO4A5]|nr:hypothetical protein [Moorena sp. SIO4A5]